MQQYLNHQCINKQEGQLLFKLRTRNLDLKNNYRIFYNNDLICRICLDPDSIEDENHLTFCPLLREEVCEDEVMIRYEDVFGPIIKQIQDVRLFMRLVKRREIYMEIMKI